MMMMKSFLLVEAFAALLLLVKSEAVRTQTFLREDVEAYDPQQQQQDLGYQQLVEWVISHGGRVDSRMTMKRDSNGIRGVLASEPIEENTELLHCPWELVIGSQSLDDQMESSEDMCNVVKMLDSQFQLGNESFYWPYLTNIDVPRLGAMWEPAAIKELQGLPPSQDIHRHHEWFSKSCRRNEDKADIDKSTKLALASFVSRTTTVGMVPIYDLLNHHNGLKNAKLFVTEDGVKLRTTRLVEAGEQLYLSYGLRPSSQMYRDYGFIEPWPRLWSWRHSQEEDNYVFATFPDGIAAIDPSVDFLKDIWASPSRSQWEWQQNATQFTQSISPSSLLKFKGAAKVLLEGLPTTWQQDEEMLKSKNAQRIRMLQQAEATTVTNITTLNEDDSLVAALDDVIAAIRYRLEFKHAVYEASKFSDTTLREMVRNSR